MNCKHIKIQGNTTKYYYCTLKNKAVDEYSCKSCMMRIADLPDGFEKIFGGLGNESRNNADTKWQSKESSHA